MSIKIKDIESCISCNNQDCCFRDARNKANFHELRSETTVCPTAVLSESPINIVDSQGIIDDKKCIDCGLCALSCHKNNLECVNVKYEINAFANLSDLQVNSIACSYLEFLFGFAANTNRNKSMQFDGYVSTHDGKEAFVEVDKENDSLESVRRLIGDFLLFSPSDRSINIGVAVLSDIPRKGSHDVYTVLEKLKEFPTTEKYVFYFTTLRLLRLLALNVQKEDLDFSDILLDIRGSDLDKDNDDSVQQYINSVQSLIPIDLLKPLKCILGII